MKLYKLITPDNAKYRIGKSGWYDTDEMIHSDTLCNAIIANCAKLYDNQKATELQKVYRDGKIKHSSLFYLLDFEKGKKTETLRFFPKPIGILPPFEIKNKNNSKVLSAKWVSEKLFKGISKKFNDDLEKLMKSKKSIEEVVLQKEKKVKDCYFVFDLKNEKIINIDNKFLLYKDELPAGMKEIPPFLSIQTEAKNQIDRLTGQVVKDENGKGQLFTEIDIVLSQAKTNGYTIKPHFYFLAEITEMKAEFEASLRLMCDEGIGGERAFGRGQFESVKIDDWDGIDLSENKICLSLVNPKNEEELKNIQFYDSGIRGGFTGKKKRKSVRMITEGSFFKEKITGQMVEVLETNRYSVYQNGNAFFGD